MNVPPVGTCNRDEAIRLLRSTTRDCRCCGRLIWTADNPQQYEPSVIDFDDVLYWAKDWDDEPHVNEIGTHDLWFYCKSEYVTELVDAAIAASCTVKSAGWRT